MGLGIPIRCTRAVHNRLRQQALDVQQAARDRIHWFYSMDYTGRRAYSEEIATTSSTSRWRSGWPNWAKLFFNNKGVAAHTTDVCAQYPPDDMSVWNW